MSAGRFVILRRYAEGWLFSLGPFVLYHAHEGHTWFRLFGSGLAWKNRNTAQLLFSDRYAGQYGIPKVRHIGRYNVERLKRRP